MKIRSHYPDVFSVIGQSVRAAVSTYLDVNLASLRRKQLTSLPFEVTASEECDGLIVVCITTHPLNACLVYFRKNPSEVVD